MQVWKYFIELRFGLQRNWGVHRMDGSTDHPDIQRTTWDTNIYKSSGGFESATCGKTLFPDHASNVKFIYSFSSLSYDRSKPLPKRPLHIVGSRASSFEWEYLLLSLRSSNSFLRLLPRLPVTSILPFTFPSITRCRRQFLRKMWPIQLAFRLRISCRIYLCFLTLSNTSSFLTC